MKPPPGPEVHGEPAGKPSAGARTFAINAVWSWITVITSLAGGLILAPYMIHKLGSDGYGVWSLVFSIVGYYTFLDFGFRSAVVNFTAREAAVRNYAKINEVLSTALAYSAGITALCLWGIAVATPRSAGWFQIGPRDRDSFPILFAVVCGGFAASFCFNIVSGCLEGFQRFASLSRIQSSIAACRAAGYFAVLWMGGGLVGLGICTIAAAMFTWAGYVVLLRKVFPEIQIHWKHVHTRVFREMAHYGLHTSTNSIATIALGQIPPVLIARWLSAAAVGYFALPLRMLQLPLEIVQRFAPMLNPMAAELTARQEHGRVVRLAVVMNRYSFVLYAPFALLVLTWGADILRLWVGPEYAINSGPLLIFFALGSWLALAGQNASIGILFGIGAHRWCAWGLMAEAAVVGAACILVLHQGLIYAAVWICIAMVANRGLFSAVVVCRNYGYPLLSFLWSIYGRPLLIAVPVFALLWKLEQMFPVKHWWMILMAAAVSGVAYFAPAFFWCVEKDHRETGGYWMRAALRRGGLSGLLAR